MTYIISGTCCCSGSGSGGICCNLEAIPFDWEIDVGAVTNGDCNFCVDYDGITALTIDETCTGASAVTATCNCPDPDGDPVPGSKWLIDFGVASPGKVRVTAVLYGDPNSPQYEMDCEDVLIDGSDLTLTLANTPGTCCGSWPATILLRAA